MIRTMLCTRGEQPRSHLDHAALVRLLADEGNLLWLDLEAATAEDLAILTTVFAFHTLAVEDAAKPHQRPKIDQYGDFYFLVCYDIDYVEEGDRVDEHELNLFLGKNDLVTVLLYWLRQIWDEGCSRGVRRTAGNWLDRWSGGAQFGHDGCPALPE